MEYAEQTKPASDEIGVFGAGSHRQLHSPKTPHLATMKKETLIAAIPAAAAVVALVIVGWWASSPKAVTKIAGDPTSDAVLTQLSAGPGPWQADQKAQALAAQLRGESRTPQVPPEKLNGSPFAFAGAVVPTVASTEPATKPVELVSDDQVKIAAAQKLQLESILFGSTGTTALISGSSVMEGQEIDGWTVSKIQDRKVILTWKTYSVTLTLK